MIYPYHCQNCDRKHDIIKPMAEYERDETCPECSGPLTRVWTVPHLIGTGVESPEYNPGLGCVVKNKRHRDQIAKERGLIEVGNDFKSGEDIQKHDDKKRQEDKKRGWAKVDEALGIRTEDSE